MCAIYMAHPAIYIGQWTTSSNENAWSLSSRTSQRMKQATSKVFLGDESKSVYIVTELNASDELLRGPEIFIITS